MVSEARWMNAWQAYGDFSQRLDRLRERVELLEDKLALREEDGIDEDDGDDELAEFARILSDMSEKLRKSRKQTMNGNR